MKGNSEYTGVTLGMFIAASIVSGCILAVVAGPKLGGFCFALALVLLPVWVVRGLIRWLSRQWHKGARA